MSASLKARLAAATDAIASASVPCSQSHRSRMCDLSRWMWLSTKPASTSRPSSCSAGASATMCPAISTTRPPATAMSTRVSLSSARRACRNRRSRAMGGASAQFLRAAEAGDHRHSQQVVVGTGLVGRDLRKVAAELSPIRLEIAFVLDRLSLDVFARHRPSLAIIAREIVLRLSSVPGLDQARRQVDRVVDAAVHAHPAERIVDMRGVAGEKSASALKRFRHPLVHFIEGGMRDLVIGNAGDYRAHERLRKLPAQRQLVAFVRRDRK